MLVGNYEKYRKDIGSLRVRRPFFEGKCFTCLKGKHGNSTNETEKSAVGEDLRSGAGANSGAGR